MSAHAFRVPSSARAPRFALLLTILLALVTAPSTCYSDWKSEQKLEKQRLEQWKAEERKQLEAATAAANAADPANFPDGPPIGVAQPMNELNLRGLDSLYTWTRKKDQYLYGRQLHLPSDTKVFRDSLIANGVILLRQAAEGGNRYAQFNYSVAIECQWEGAPQVSDDQILHGLWLGWRKKSGIRTQDLPSLPGLENLIGDPRLLPFSDLDHERLWRMHQVADERLLSCLAYERGWGCERSTRDLLEMFDNLRAKMADVTFDDSLGTPRLNVEKAFIMRYFAELYEDGRVLGPDPFESAYLYRYAAELGDPVALLAWGDIVWGAGEDPAQRERACELWSSSWRYGFGTRDYPSEAAALQAARDRCEFCVAAQVEVGNVTSLSQRLTSILDSYPGAGRRGSTAPPGSERAPADADRSALAAYLERAGPERNCERVEVAHAIEAGLWPPYDSDMVFSLYKRAAAMGDVWGAYHLGRVYEAGIGTPQDLDRARAAYRGAADRGCSVAINALARLLEPGYRQVPATPFPVRP